MDLDHYSDVILFWVVLGFTLRFGTGRAAGRCYMEPVSNDTCGPEGFISNDYNFYKLDDQLNASAFCSRDRNTIGSYVQVGDTCWRHSHPNEGSVFDFSRWAIAHPGNRDALWNSHLNPITKIAEEGSHELFFPPWHDMSRWEDHVSHWRDPIVYVGEFGAHVDFSELPKGLQTTDMAIVVGAILKHVSPIGFESCGSRGEVGSEPSLGHQYSVMDGGYVELFIGTRKCVFHS